MEVDKKYFAANVNHYLKLRNMTQKTLAEQMNYSPARVNQFMRKEELNEAVVKNFAEALGVQPEDLLVAKSETDYLIEDVMKTQPDSVIDRIVKEVTLPTISENYPVVRFYNGIKILLGLFLCTKIQAPFFFGIGALLAVDGLYYLNAFRKKQRKFFRVYNVIVLITIVISLFMTLYGLTTIW